MVLQNNYFIEEILPNAILRKLSDEEIIAFEMICAALKYTNRPDIAHKALANRTIELAKNGVLDPDRLCERVLDDLRKLPPRF
jgi:hypothetical protein